MKGDGGSGSGSNNPDHGREFAALETASAGSSRAQRRGMLATLRYGSSNLLLLLGAPSLIIGGWAPWVVLALALGLGSFADELAGDDDNSLKESRCVLCTVNLYLSLPLVCLLAFLLVRFAAERPSLTENP